VYANKGLKGALSRKCVQISGLLEIDFARQTSRGPGGSDGFLFSDLLQIFSQRLCELCAENFSCFFRPQKVHYNALFSKIRRPHAL
jgi:hypothetical protein